MGYRQEILKGTSGLLATVTIRRTDTGQLKAGLAFGDMTINYLREGAASLTSVTPVTMTAGTWASGGWVEVGSGVYQFGVPNAALVSGANAVEILFQAANAIDQTLTIVLQDVNHRDAVAFGLSRLDESIGSRESETSAASRATTNQNEHAATQAAIATIQADTDDIQTRLPAALVSGRIDASVGAMAADVVTAAAMAADASAEIADAVWDEAIAGHLGAGSTGAALNGATAPTAAAVADAVWDEAKSGHVAAGSFGEEVQSHATPTEVKSQADQALMDYDPPTKSELDSFQSAMQSEHNATQAELANATYGLSALNTDLDTLLSRLTSARALLLDNLDVAVSSRSDHTSTDVWNVLETAILQANSIGLKIKTNLDEAISSRSSHTPANVDSVLTASHGTGSWQSGSGGLSAADIADAIWDEAKSDHTASGSFGEEIQAHATVSEIDSQLSGSHGSGSWESSSTSVDNSNFLTAEVKNSSIISGELSSDTIIVATVEVDEV